MVCPHDLSVIGLAPHLSFIFPTKRKNKKFQLKFLKIKINRRFFFEEWVIFSALSVYVMFYANLNLIASFHISLNPKN